MTVRLHLLGVPTAEGEGKILQFPFRKAEALLYFLALEKRAGREGLATLLWGDKDEVSARNNLRNALYVLGRTLPSEALTAERHSVALGEVTLDTDEIPLLEDPSVPLPEVLFRELLEEFDIPDSPSFSEWLTLRRGMVREEILQTLRKRISRCYEDENREGLAESLEALLRIDPYDEHSVLELMELYVNSGSPARAISLYTGYREQLARQMDLHPSPRAEEIFFRILRRKEEDVSGESPENCFYGRKEEMARIFELLGRQEQSLRCTLISGEPGVGKTSLARKVLSSILHEGTTLFTLRAYEAEQSFPYSPWNDFVSALGELADLSSPSLDPLKLALVAGIFPGFMKNRKFNSSSDVALVSQGGPAVLGRVLADLTEEVGRDGPLVFLMEDVHWFDPSSLVLAESFLFHLSVPAVFFLTSRPEGADSTDRMLKSLERGGSLQYLSLPLLPFGREETLLFCRRFLDPDVIASRGEDYFYGESEGLPWLLVELIKSLREKSGVDWRKGIGSGILARLGRMSDFSVRFLQILSHFPQGATLPVLAKIMKKPSLELSATAEELLRKGMIEESDSRGGEGAILFRHEKIRECIYESVPAFRRKEIHGVIGEILGESWSLQIRNPFLSARLRHHFTLAGRHDRALDQLLREMTFHITLNHELFPLVQDWVFRSCVMPFSDRADTEGKMDEVMELLHTLNRNVEGNREVLRMEAAYLELRGGYSVAWGQYREGRLFIGRALKIAEKNGFDLIRIRCLQHMGHYHLQTDNWRKLLPCAREMLRLAKGSGRDDYAGVALRFLGVAFQLQGNFDLADRVFGQSIALFEELKEMGKNYTLSVLAARCYRGEILHWRGDLEQALECFNSCIKGCEEAGFVWGSSHFHAHAADAAFDLEDFPLMDFHLERGIEIFERSQGGRCGSILYSLKAIADARRGRMEEAFSALHRGEALCSPIRKKSWSAVQSMAKAFVAEEARKRGQEAGFTASFGNTGAAFAAEAAELYRSIPSLHRVKILEETFGNRQNLKVRESPSI